MTKEEEQLLLKDLCGRLPYDVLYAEIVWEDGPAYEVSFINTGVISDLICDEIKSIKPYLRPMSSMTKEEKILMATTCLKYANGDVEGMVSEFSEFYNSRHLDYHGLIGRGLALEAPEGMYKSE